VSVIRSVSRRFWARARGLTFQSRLALVAALAVAPLLASAAFVTYVIVQTNQLGQIDDLLRVQAVNTTVHPIPGLNPRLDIVVPRQAPGEPLVLYQVLGADGNPVPAGGSHIAALPVNEADREVAAGGRDESSHSGFTGSGAHVRILTRRIESTELSLQASSSLADLDRNLAYLRLGLTMVTAGGIAVTALLGRLVAQAALRPIYRLRQAVDHVTETGDMTQRVPGEGQDELSRLGAHFNRMMGALEQALRIQRQLVADASHELRTPLASLRTNIEVLQRSPNLPAEEREKLLRDVVSQVEQLTRLIQDLIDLARGDQAPEENEEVRLDWVVAAAMERAATNWPMVNFHGDLVESMVVGQSGRLDRAVSNLLDNAGKWSPPGAEVEVRVTDHEVIVRDHGPGIDHADLPYVFDRFWRAPAARGMPGSGLGLSIVRQVAEAHGGTVTAELPPDGGTLMRMKLPDVARPPAPVPQKDPRDGRRKQPTMP
jgi:two-component system sensor histidine kinase MprB